MQGPGATTIDILILGGGPGGLSTALHLRRARDIRDPALVVLQLAVPPCGISILPKVLNMPSVLSFDTETSLAEAAAIYQEQMPDLGWTLIGGSVITETTALLEFTQGNQIMTVTITAGVGVTNGTILLEKDQE